MMSPSAIFQLANTFVLIGWLLLIFAPKWQYTHRVVLQIVVAILAAVYVVLIAPTLADFSPDAFSTLENVRTLFQNDSSLAAGWVHYLAFDLFVGAYIVKEGIASGLARWKYTICLPFTFMFGPVGLLLNFIIRRLIP